MQELKSNVFALKRDCLIPIKGGSSIRTPTPCKIEHGAPRYCNSGLMGLNMEKR